jgi:hypothetical protein
LYSEGSTAAVGRRVVDSPLFNRGSLPAVFPVEELRFFGDDDAFAAFCAFTDFFCLARSFALWPGASFFSFGFVGGFAPSSAFLPAGSLLFLLNIPMLFEIDCQGKVCYAKQYYSWKRSE